MTERPEPTPCFKALKAGAVPKAWTRDRHRRSRRHLTGLLDDLNARAAAFPSLTEAIDTATPMGRMMWQMVGRWAARARSPIQERPKAGRTATTVRSVPMGRKP